MTEYKKPKIYDLEERTYNFAKNCRELIRKISKSISNIEDSSQLARSSGSVAANYIEANEAISKKDFTHRIKICRKESKESKLWLRLLFIEENLPNAEREKLIQEATELTKIFNSIVNKSL